MSLSGDDLLDIFGNNKSKNPSIKELTSNSWESNSFNYSKFINNYTKLFLDGSYEGNPEDYLRDSKELDIYHIDYIKGLVPLIIQEYCSLFYNAISHFKNKTIEKIAAKIEDTSEIKIEPINYYRAVLPKRGTTHYLRYIQKQNDTNNTQKVSILDRDLNIIEDNDSLYNLLLKNSKEELDSIFLKYNVLIGYD